MASTGADLLFPRQLRFLSCVSLLPLIHLSPLLVSQPLPPHFLGRQFRSPSELCCWLAALVTVLLLPQAVSWGLLKAAFPAPIGIDLPYLSFLFVPHHPFSSILLLFTPYPIYRYLSSPLSLSSSLPFPPFLGLFPFLNPFSQLPSWPWVACDSSKSWGIEEILEIGTFRTHLMAVLSRAQAMSVVLS